ncbi:Maf family protein, partial [Pseudomonas aeruginosa]
MPDLILASSSPYRRELLTRLRLPFESASPDIDESHRPGESAE